MNDSSDLAAGCFGVILYLTGWFIALYVVVRFVKWVWLG